MLVDHVVVERRLHLHHHPIMLVLLAIHETDVGASRLTVDTYAVVPALAGEVAQPTLPLDEQVGSHEPLDRRVVAGIPGPLRGKEELARVALHPLGGKRSVVLRRLR